MLDKILKLYTMAMAGDVRSPVPHIVGPPGCGKSTSIEQAAECVGKKVHILNVSRMSPLDTEGVQMPHGAGEEMALRMLHATYWTQLEEGDVVHFEEFLRGFPEVYNALLDIWTSRTVAGMTLPKVFIIASSNSITTYDKALDDRLLHLPVADIRTDHKAQDLMKHLFVEALGLLPEMVNSDEVQSMIDLEVVPMYAVLDSLKNRTSTPIGHTEGSSIRKLIGQAQLREIQSLSLRDVIEWNNRRAIQQNKFQYVLLPDAKNVDAKYVKNSKALPRDKLTPVQRLNLDLNHQLIGLEEVRRPKGIKDDGSDNDPFS